MPLPLILGVGAAVAGVAGVGSGVHGAKKMKDAKDTMKSAESRHKSNITRFENQNKVTTNDMDNLGKKELEILKSFDDFVDVFERIQGRPEFKTYNKDGINIPKYDEQELKKVSIGAGVLLGGISGAALGTAGGFAAAGATTAAVMALGTASTGASIASLSGVAATNATLAALGGGAIAAGGGGMALGSTILGAATLGVGLLVGGVIFNITGSSLSNKADEAWSQVLKAEREIDKLCLYMKDLSNISQKYNKAISSVEKVYRDYLNRLMQIVYIDNKTDWNEFTDGEKLITENTVLLVNLLFNMGKVKLVLISEDESEHNRINTEEVNKSIENAERFIKENVNVLNNTANEIILIDSNKEVNTLNQMSNEVIEVDNTEEDNKFDYESVVKEIENVKDILKYLNKDLIGNFINNEIDNDEDLNLYISEVIMSAIILTGDEKLLSLLDEETKEIMIVKKEALDLQLDLVENIFNSDAIIEIEKEKISLRKAINLYNHRVKVAIEEYEDEEDIEAISESIQIAAQEFRNVLKKMIKYCNSFIEKIYIEV